MSLNFYMLQKIAPTDIHRYLSNVYGNQKEDVTTVKRQVVHFSSEDSDVRLKKSCFLRRFRVFCESVTGRRKGKASDGDYERKSSFATESLPYPAMFSYFIYLI